ncbi:MAG: tetratricopeptide repeat protein [Acidobacteria bacterium]|nr:tetratricopeptide repeat protein [Acidobacteriota bacterium]
MTAVHRGGSARTKHAAILLALLACMLRVTPSLAQSPVTFAKDIAPIVHAKCGVCHRPGGAAPFSLLTYASARGHATQMALLTRSGVMPPWQADGDYGGEFVGQPRLTPEEVDLFQRWQADGAPEGDRALTPVPPEWTEGWQLGKPDLIVTTPPYTLQADGTDSFRVFVIKLPVSVMKYVRGMEFKPGNPRVVHHANIRIDHTDASRKFDEAEPGPGYSGLIANSAVYPDGHFLGWTPGQVPPLLPKGLAWRLEPNTDLVVELHMQPSGREEPVQASVGFYFTSDPPERTPAMLRLGRQSIDIPPGEKEYVITDSFVTPVDVEVQAVQPHAHYRAKEIVGFANLPDGSVRPLIHIRRWDFRWQHVYRYVTPFWLPKGTRLQMRYTYDNSPENPRNPDQPPRRVYWGQRSSDEMGDLWIQVLTRTDRDLALLNDQFGTKVMTEDTIGYERWLESEPDSAPLHTTLAALYLELKKPQDAVRHFRAAAHLEPESAPAHFNLGTALTVAGDYDSAVLEYQRALAIRKDYPQAHNNLASILLSTGKAQEALTHLAEALRLDPSNAQAHYNAGIASLRLGKQPDAIAHLKKAVELAPDSPGPLVDLAWLLAASPLDALRDPGLAIRLAERAVSLTMRKDAGALDVLAAAQAANDDFDRAVDTANAALALKPADASAIAARRDGYRQRLAFRLPR